MKVKRVCLKMSGEALLGEKAYGIDYKGIKHISKQIAEIKNLGIDLAIVIGGGNIFRGDVAAEYGMDRSTADYTGMLATLMNAIALQDSIETEGIPTRVQSAIELKSLCEPFIKRRAIRHLEKGRIVIFAGGTGNPYFTTDTAAVLRSMEINADVLFKATKVDGVFDKDPLKDDTAVKYDELTFKEALRKDLKIMDLTALSLCKVNNLSIRIFNIFIDGNIKRAVLGENIGTLISNNIDS